MGWLGDFVNDIKKKKEEMDDRRRFLEEVEQKTKPLRRAAYMKQMLKESVQEGIDKAKFDAAKKNKKITGAIREDTLMDGINNPMKYLENHPEFKQGNPKPKKSKNKSKEKSK